MAVVFGTAVAGGGTAAAARRRGVGRRPGSIENIYYRIEQFFFLNIYAGSMQAGGVPVEKQDCGMERWGGLL